MPEAASDGELHNVFHTGDTRLYRLCCRMQKNIETILITQGWPTVPCYGMGCRGWPEQRLGPEIWEIFQGVVLFWGFFLPQFCFLCNISRFDRSILSLIWQLFVPSRYHSSAPVRYSVQPRFYSRFLWFYFTCVQNSIKYMYGMKLAFAFASPPSLVSIVASYDPSWEYLCNIFSL